MSGRSGRRVCRGPAQGGMLVWRRTARFPPVRGVPAGAHAIRTACLPGPRHDLTVAAAQACPTAIAQLPTPQVHTRLAVCSATSAGGAAR